MEAREERMERRREGGEDRREGEEREGGMDRERRTRWTKRGERGIWHECKRTETRPLAMASFIAMAMATLPLWSE